MKVIIAAAGTAGHINPALSIASKLEEKCKINNEKLEIVFIGTGRGLEKDLVPRAGYKLETVEAYGFAKKPTIDNIKKLSATFLSFFKAKKIIKEFNPDIVIGTGGYVCVPVILAANALKIPTFLHESNAFPGLAIKLFDGKATKILLGLKEATKHFKHKENLVFVGNPTKIKKVDFSKEEKKAKLEELGFSEDKKTIIVFGGSQGAEKINENIYKLILNNIKNEEDVKYQIIWATGQDRFEKYAKLFESENLDIENIPNAKIYPYIYNMHELLNLADLGITRAGAMTITELSIIGLPSIFVPLYSMNANKQEDNAKVFENADARIYN